MLSKVDEAAYPWALIKGLSEQALGVSCVAGSSHVAHAATPFDASRLVQLALAPLAEHLPQAALAQPAVPVLSAVSVAPVTRVAPSAPVRVARAPKPTAAKAPPSLTPPAKPRGKKVVSDDIVIPTFMGSLPTTPARRPSAKAAAALKVAHG